MRKIVLYFGAVMLLFTVSSFVLVKENQNPPPNASESAKILRFEALIVVFNDEFMAKSTDGSILVPLRCGRRTSDGAPIQEGDIVIVECVETLNGLGKGIIRDTDYDDF